MCTSTLLLSKVYYVYFYHKLVGDRNAVQTSLIMGLVKTPNWIYNHVYK